MGVEGWTMERVRQRVRRAQPKDRDQLAEMRVLLWPERPPQEHINELEAYFATGRSGTLPMAIFAAEDADGALVGFLEAGLRSHADGCDPARPVGFVEGWFVREEFRGRGAGAELMQAAEEWARTQRCREIASDALIENSDSHKAHEALGFHVVDRCVHYRKEL
jgi:aminoglycoside 6'-N-acetyltransferase I